MKRKQLVHNSAKDPHCKRIDDATKIYYLFYSFFLVIYMTTFRKHR